MTEMNETVKRALGVADAAEKITITPQMSIVAQERFMALGVLAGEVKNFYGVAPDKAHPSMHRRNCNCRSTWEDFEIASTRGHALAEIGTILQNTKLSPDDRLSMIAAIVRRYTA